MGKERTDDTCSKALLGWSVHVLVDAVVTPEIPFVNLIRVATLQRHRWVWVVVFRSKAAKCATGDGIHGRGTRERISKMFCILESEQKTSITETGRSGGSGAYIHIERNPPPLHQHSQQLPVRLDHDVVLNFVTACTSNSSPRSLCTPMMPHCPTGMVTGSPSQWRGSIISSSSRE